MHGSVPHIQVQTGLSGLVCGIAGQHCGIFAACFASVAKHHTAMLVRCEHGDMFCFVCFVLLCFDLLILFLESDSQQTPHSLPNIAAYNVRLLVLSCQRLSPGKSALLLVFAGGTDKTGGKSEIFGMYLAKRVVDSSPVRCC